MINYPKFNLWVSKNKTIWRCTLSMSYSLNRFFFFITLIVGKEADTTWEEHDVLATNCYGIDSVWLNAVSITFEVNF